MQLTFRGIVDEIYGSGVPGLYIGDEVSGKLIVKSQLEPASLI
jgi:hypothetical protein